MAVQDAATLKSYFNTGDVPTESQFADLIDTIDSKGTGGVTDHGALTGLEDNDHPQYSLATHNHTGTYEPADATIVKDADIGVTVASFSHTHNYAPALGADENYVTDTEKAALHSHTNKSTLDKITEAGNTPLWNGGAWPSSGGGGDMYKSVYDPDLDGIIAYAQLSGVAAALGSDDNYVTDAEKTKLSNLSGTNTGDQDLSGYSLTGHNHSLNNLTEKSYNSLTDKPSIPSITGLLDETAHDALDHTGLTGIPAAYSLPTATTSVLGGVKVDGTSITINSGVISSSATGGGMTSESKSSSFTAAKDHRYIVDTSAGTVTATLPASPSVGDYIEFVDAGSTWTGHDLVLARNSLKINGESTDFTCDADNVQVSITYTGSTYGWAVKVGASVLTAAPHTTGSHSDWPAGVSMTEVGYLNGVTSAIQNQINQAIGFKNVIINGNFNVNQRAYASGADVGTGLYGHDRWKMSASGDTYTFSTTENVTTITIPSGKVLRQVIEGLNLQSGTYTLSWTGTAQGKIGAGSYGASGITGTATGGTNLTIEFGPGTVSKVQFEFGTVVTPFEARPYGAELALCQRYYQKSFPLSTAPAQNAGLTGALVALGVGGWLHVIWYLPVRLRLETGVSSAVTTYNPMAANANFQDGTVPTIGSVSGAGLVYIWSVSATTQSNIHATVNAEL